MIFFRITHKYRTESSFHLSVCTLTPPNVLVLSLVDLHSEMSICWLEHTLGTRSRFSSSMQSMHSYFLRHVLCA